MLVTNSSTCLIQLLLGASIPSDDGDSRTISVWKIQISNKTTFYKGF